MLYYLKGLNITGSKGCIGMPKTEAQKRANAKYESKAYSKVLLRLRNDTEPTRDSITMCAQACGESLNEYIIKAVIARMEKQ